ncbi:MAG: efflux transporter outer membrane subunit [Planctomycetota bacterium]|jgi:NodT family efflux transporter outer membrane factor (OMF) lipoprotein
MRLSASLLVLLLAACKAVGPDYERPKTEGQLPADFNAPPDPAFKPGSEGLEKWWEVFEDPQLVDLIGRAADQNLDVRLALARVNEARARVAVMGSQNAPQVGVGASGGAGAMGGLGAGGTYNVGVDAGWELDVWGRISRQVEAATAEFEATVEDQRDVSVSLYAEVARHYLAVRTFQDQLRVAQRNIEAQRDILKITQGRFAAGLSSRLDVAQAERVLANSEAEVPPLQIELVRAINTIGVLLGRFPRDVHEELSTDKPIPVPPEQVSVGVPANLVRQRPDIRGAERRLAAQTARVGVATAQLYPQFSLNGSFGYQDFGGGGQLFNAGGRSFFLGPSMRWNIFTGGRVRAQIKAADFRVEQALLTYEATVLRAIEEVESAMTAFLQQRVRAAAMGRAASVAREELELGMTLYKEGLVNFQNILDAERALFALEIQVSEARGEASINLVRLYKALGGGWNPETVAKPDPKKYEEQPATRRTLEED